jgi:hypothetical protein
VLANILTLILLEVMSQHPSAFVPGHFITENILIAYECVHTIKRNREKKGICAVKLDMHIAYGKVECCFLDKMMIKLGFAPQWVKLIMACFSPV